ncbi:MAG: hypothetical protein ABSA02_36195 [Trebonia sp.]|jgi:hypothetical protein
MNAEHADLEARFAAPAERDLPPGRHELHREILMNHMLTESGQNGPATARHRRPRRRMLTVGGTAGLGIAAAAVAVTLIATSTARPPAAPARPVAGGTAQAHGTTPATPTVSSPLVLLADNITASAHNQPGDATLVFRSTTFTDGTAPGSGFDLYTDSGPYYWAPTESGLPAQIAAHHNLGGGLFTREIAAAEYAVSGDLATARERMASAPDPANAGQLPSAHMIPALLKAKAEMMGVKAAPGQSLAAAYDKAWLDNWVWGDATDALEAGAGNPQVRAGVLRLLSTVSGVVVTHGTLDGQPTLVVGDVTPALNGQGSSEGAMTLNASTGIPLEYTDGLVGQTPDSTTTYQVSRVTVADIEAGKF